MSIENRGGRDGEPLSQEERLALNGMMLDFLQTERPSYTLAEEKPGTILQLETVDGSIDFSVHPWGKEETIEPGVAVYATIMDGMKLVDDNDKIAIFGPAEGMTVDPDALGTIKQYSELVYCPIKWIPLSEEDRSLSDEDFAKKVKTGQIVKHDGIFQSTVRQGDYQTIPTVLSLFRKFPDTAPLIAE